MKLLSKLGGNMNTDIGGTGTGHIKKEVDFTDFNEAFQTDMVKLEPCEINIFSKCETYKTDFVDQKNATFSYQDQIEDTIHENKYNLEDHPKVSYDFSSSECKSEQMKNENNIDIFYEDVSCIDEKNSSELSKFCEVCNKSLSNETEFIDSQSNNFKCSCQKQNNSIILHVDDMTQVVKPPFLALNTDFGLQLLGVQDKTSPNEYGNKQVSLAAPQRDSEHLLKNDKELTPPNIPDGSIIPKRECSSMTTGNNIFVKPQTTRNRGLETQEMFPTEEKLFSCNICSKTFSRQGYLRAHKRIHTGKKPFHCRFCSKIFNKVYDLQVHERVHTGEKPFICKTCSKSFSSLQYLKIHEMNHTWKSPLHCKICWKCFGSLKSLKNHEMLHTSGKPVH